MDSFSRRKTKKDRGQTGNKMRSYHELLAEKKAINTTLNAEIKQKKQELHKQFVMIHHKELKYLDIAVAIIILMNFGAVFITNFMVQKERAEIVDQGGTVEPLREVNPLPAKMNNYEIHPQSKQIMKAVANQFLLWFVMLWAYVQVRRNMFTDTTLTTTIIIVVSYLVILGWDFFNDFGYLVGSWVW